MPRTLTLLIKREDRNVVGSFSRPAFNTPLNNNWNMRVTLQNVPESAAFNRLQHRIYRVGAVFAAGNQFPDHCCWVSRIRHRSKIIDSDSLRLSLPGFLGLGLGP